MGAMSLAILFGTMLVGPHHAILLGVITNAASHLQFLPQGMRDGDWRVARQVMLGNFAGSVLGIWIFGQVSSAWLTFLLGLTLGAVLITDMINALERLSRRIDLRASSFVVPLSAISFTTPLWMIIAAAVLLGEGSDSRRWLATAIAFGGILVIVRPDMDPDPAMLAALASAILGSLSLACVKKLSQFESALTITFYFSFIGTLISIVAAIFTWVRPTLLEYLLLAATGGFAVTGLLCAARAYNLADATVVSPVDFTRLPFAIAIGYVAVGESPDVWTLSGSVIIMASILYIGRRAEVRA